MILIAHRGNVHGPQAEMENRPDYIDASITAGYDVEIDVWQTESGYFLGHDEPQYKVDLEFLLGRSENLWIHTKNLQALESLLSKSLHVFWHQEDDYTLTSKGIIWTYPGTVYGEEAVIVCKDLETTLLGASTVVQGICSDYVGNIE